MDQRHGPVLPVGFAARLPGVPLTRILNTALDAVSMGSISHDFKSGSDLLLVTFAGLRGQLGMPMFEFVESTDVLGISRMMVRDRHSLFYLKGLPGLSRDVESTIDVLRRRIGWSGAKRVVMLGNSGGGFGAILFGCLLDADEIHSFVPRTLVDPERPDMMSGRPAKDALERLRPQRDRFLAFMDLKELVARSSQPDIHIYFSTEVDMDERHALRLAGLPGVKLHRRPGGHAVVKEMRDSGELLEVLRTALRP